MTTLFRSLLMGLIMMGGAAPSLYEQRLVEESRYGPGMVAFDWKVFMAWTGTDGHINVMRSDNGIDWGAKIRLDETSSKSPTLTTFDDELILAWIGERDRKINVARPDDGIEF